MIGMAHRGLLFAFLMAILNCSAQQSLPGAKLQTKATAPVEAATVTPQAFDLQAVVNETKQADMQRGKVGIFWWIPPDFWEGVGQQQGLEKEKAVAVFKVFRNYNLFMVAVGTLEAGHPSWPEESVVKKNVVLRDQRGNTYKPLQELPEDIRPFLELMRTILKNSMGQFGEGTHFLVFPVKDGAGNVFADGHKSSEIFLDVVDLMGPPTKTYTWKLPLTALSPPKYCPVGKEKVEANWKYCPWHGNKLAEPDAGTSVPVTP